MRLTESRGGCLVVSQLEMESFWIEGLSLRVATREEFEEVLDQVLRVVAAVVRKI